MKAWDNRLSVPSAELVFQPLGKLNSINIEESFMSEYHYMS